MKLLDFFNYQKNMSLCGICNEYIKAENSTPSSCSHAFHVTCLKNWIESHRSDNQCKCPSKQCCRTFTAISIRNSIGGPVTKNISLAYDNQCPICCEEIEPPVATPESCNHHFCFSCLKEWAKIRHECPLDRGAFELILLSQYIGGPITDRVSNLNTAFLAIHTNSSRLIYFSCYSDKLLLPLDHLQKKKTLPNAKYATLNRMRQTSYSVIPAIKAITPTVSQARYQKSLKEIGFVPAVKMQFNSALVRRVKRKRRQSIRQ